jgi:hypothetical protein
MRPKLKNSVVVANRLFSRLAAEKKKTVIAVCLIALMVFMWARVLGRKTPQSAEAAATAQETGQPNSELKISFIELPKIKGRHDVLDRDFFAADGWRSFTRDAEGKNLTGIKEVSVVSGDDSEEVVRRVAEKLKLEAIGLGKNPRAFINNKLLSVGDKLLISEGADMYECEVVGIEEHAVFIRCGEAEITLKLTRVIEDSE